MTPLDLWLQHVADVPESLKVGDRIVIDATIPLADALGTVEGFGPGPDDTPLGLAGDLFMTVRTDRGTVYLRRGRSVEIWKGARS